MDEQTTKEVLELLYEIRGAMDQMTAGFDKMSATLSRMEAETEIWNREWKLRRERRGLPPHDTAP